MKRWIFFILALSSIGHLAAQGVPSSELNFQEPAAGREESDAFRGYTINFNDVSIIEFIRYISRISDKNFIFDEQELNFNVSIVSQEATSIENIMAVLLQVLRIRGLTLLEQGNNVIIHKNSAVKRPARVVTDRGESSMAEENQLVTRVFRVDFVEPSQVAAVIQPLVSDQAQIEILEDSRHLVVTDLTTNVQKIAELIASLDQPNAGFNIGQYVAQNLQLDSLVALAEKILRPIAGETPLFIVPQQSSNSIFIISSPYFVQRAVAVLETVDVPFGRTRVFSFDSEDYERQARDKEQGDNLDSIFGDKDSQQDLFGTNQDELLPSGFEINDAGQVIDETGEVVAEDADAFLKERQQRIGARFGRFRDPRDFETPDFTFSFPGSGVQSEFELPDTFDEDLPIGHIDATHFYIHKLQYRKGDQIQSSLAAVATSLAQAGTVNIDLLSTISSAQWIETSNSILFTGNRASLAKVKELMTDIDTPLRQVFIEMLIIETSIANSLNFGVDVGGVITQPDLGANVGSYRSGTGLLNGLGSVSAGSNIEGAPLGTAGFVAHVIGSEITFGGTAFKSLGVLLTALQSDGETNVIMNPKIMTEDNTTAEIFVGQNERYLAQTVLPDGSQAGAITNYEFRDTGSRLRVTPLLGNNDVVTLEIDQEISTSTTGEASNTGGTEQAVEGNLGPVSRLARTTTRVHIPDKYFLIISGMIQDERTRNRNQVPCLGGLPLIGSAFGQTSNTISKRNLVIFIRPEIIDTDDEIRRLTKTQQDLFRDKSRPANFRKREICSTLEFLNLK